MQYLVYGLIDPRTRLIRYVGKSSSGLTRPRMHSQPRSLKPKSHKNAWLRGLFASGGTYEIVILETLEDPKALGSLCWWRAGDAPENNAALNDAECWWIAYGRALGWPLTNLTDGGDGVNGYKHSKEARTVIGRHSLLQWEESPWRRSLARDRMMAYNRSPEVLRATNAKLTDPVRLARKSEENTVRNNQPNIILKDLKGLWSPDKVLPCGTTAAYSRATHHKRTGRSSCGPCELCSEAARESNRQRRNRI